MLINTRVSFIDKKGVCAIFIDYRYFFFTGDARKWFLQISNNEKVIDDEAKYFIKYLEENRLIIKKPTFLCNEQYEKR